MSARRASLGLLLALIALAGCPSATPHESSGPPPPAGQSFRDYLGGPREEPVRETRPPDTDDADAMVYHFIDVGQGTSILLEFPCGAALIDTGGEQNDEFDSRKALLDYLDDFFVRRHDLKRTLDLLVITHPHLDHDRWVLDVVEAFRVKNVIDNGQVTDEPGGAELLALHDWVQKRGRAVGHRDIFAREVEPPYGLSSSIIDPVGTCAQSDVNPMIRALWGQVTEELDTYGNKPNLHSIVLRIDFGKSSALLVADLEILGAARMAARFEKHPEILDVDLYQVGHHGSRNGSVAHLLKAMSPKLAVIPCGPYERNQDWTARRYGHPNNGILELLGDPARGVSGLREEPIEVWAGLRGAWKEKKEEFVKTTVTRAIYSTAWDGTVRVVANANGWIEVKTERADGAGSPR